MGKTSKMLSAWIGALAAIAGWSAGCAADTEDPEGAEAEEALVVGAPDPIFPWNGYATGTPFAPAGRRPTFRWRSMPGVSAYELQLDDKPSFLQPEAVETVRDLSTGVVRHQVATIVPISEVRPVGRRYYWRVRALGSSVWSATRYVDIGRQTNDYDGDGYADALMTSSPHTVSVYYGSQDGIVATDGQPIVDPIAPDGFINSFGTTLSALGDVNGDGFADALIADSEVRNEPIGGNARQGAAHLYFGSPAGLSANPALTLIAPAALADVHTFFASNVQGVGDLNTDGHADALVFAYYNSRDGLRSRGTVSVYLGTAAGFEAEPSAVIEAPSTIAGNRNSFGYHVGALGDVNGDGRPDVGISAHYDGNDAPFEGNAFIYYGSNVGLQPRPNVTLDNPTDQPFGYFGETISGVDDVNGDGYADIAIGAPGQNHGANPQGSVFIFTGSRAGIRTEPSTELHNPRYSPPDGSSFGGGFAAFDVNSDGFSDLAVASASYYDDSYETEGYVHIYLGARDGLGRVPSLTLEDPTHTPGGSFGIVIADTGDLDGDGDSELLVDSGHTPGSPPEAGSVYLYAGTPFGFRRDPSLVLGSEFDPGRHFYFGNDIASSL